MDKETTEVLRDGKELQDLVQSEGWIKARAMLLKKCAQIDTISQLPENMKTEEVLTELQTRRGAIKLIIEWIADVEGSASQSEDIAKVFNKVKDEEIVKSYE